VRFLISMIFCCSIRIQPVFATTLPQLDKTQLAGGLSTHHLLQAHTVVVIS
jgi:hypothetical protein